MSGRFSNQSMDAPSSVTITKRSNVNKENEPQHPTITSTGTQVYVWGADATGQLGLQGKRSFIQSPKVFNWNIQIALVSCGRDHTAILSKQGQLYTMGSNTSGKLGYATPAKKI